MKLSTGFRRLVLLAPTSETISHSLHPVSDNHRRYEDLLRQVQCLRGAAYLEDGAIGEQEMKGGRHMAEGDRESWHLLVMSNFGNVLGCVRYRKYDAGVSYSDLFASKCPALTSGKWSASARAAVEEELALAKNLDIPFAEVGGWALDPSIRGSVEALRMILGIYALSHEFGGAIGLATATTRHSSSSILQRMGGRRFEHDGVEIPAYLDAHYNCEMELLRFHSWAPNPRYLDWIGQMREEIRSTPIVTPAVSPGVLPACLNMAARFYAGCSFSSSPAVALSTSA